MLDLFEEELSMLNFLNYQNYNDINEADKDFMQEIINKCYR